MVSLPVFAAENQENPDTARVIYDGMSLFNFYTDTLDFILIRNQSGVNSSVQKAPYANIPVALSESLTSFVGSSQSLSGVIINLDENIPQIQTLLQQSRYSEAAPLIKNAFANIALAETNLNSVEQATTVTGTQFLVAKASVNSGIAVSYAAVLDRIQRLRDLIALLRSMLNEQIGGLTPEQISAFTNGQISALTQEQLAKILAEILNTKPLLQTQITLTIAPTEAFVGDTIKVEGILSSDGNPLGNRQVNILLNSLQSLTVSTDSDGRYSSDLKVPYWYIPIIQVQSLYYPRSDDVGVYSSSLSPPVTLNVLYYNALLTLKTDTNAYPGKEASIVGQFDYGQSPSLDPRKIEVDLDNTLVSESEVSPGFTEKLLLSPDMETGKHLVTISAPASGRYASVTADATLNVKKVVPILTIYLPSVAFIPGKMSVKGQLNSELGPVGKAHITMTFGKGKADIVSGDDGTFSATIKNDMSFGLFGSQTLEFSAITQEPWQDNLTTSRNVMTVYIVNCGAFLLVLAILGILLPRRIRFRRVRKINEEKVPAVGVTQNEATPEFNISIVKSLLPEEEAQNNNTPDKKLFYWYRIIIQLVQKVSGVFLKPNQTLREFVTESGNKMGLAGKYLLEFTKIVEKVLYSPYKVTENDAKSGEELARNMRESLKK
jgi:hypothetical protein